MKLIHWTFLCVCASASVFAQDIKVVGTVDETIKLPRTTSFFNITPAAVKHISLLKIELSDRARQKIAERAGDAINVKTALSSDLSNTNSSVYLGMGSVPVLDQGSFGSCVMFANTAAVDAVLDQGDYISQLCLLQLGRYLAENAYVSSGWDGSLGPIVLNQIASFGYVSKAKQVAYGCGGLTQYPLSGGIGGEPGTAMSLADYRQLSEKLDDNRVAWSTVLDVYQFFIDKIDPDRTLEQVKEALQAGDRLTFGVLLPDTQKGVVGAIGKYHVNNDSWVLTPEIIEDLKTQKDLPGHEMIVTGYDDNAVALDDHARPHQGLLILRNSWGSGMGNKGDFYMSYDYFKTLTLEIQRIRSIG